MYLDVMGYGEALSQYLVANIHDFPVFTPLVIEGLFYSVPGVEKPT